MYAEEIIEKPYMLDVDYLIFGYDMTDDGYVVIKDLWLKKVWQITRRMEDYPINLQVKDGVIHKIRPAAWYSEAVTDYSVFTSLEDFICAIEETVYLEPKFRNTIASTWLTKFKRNYKATFGVELDIPRWNSIKDKYDMKSVRIKEKAQEDVSKAEEALQKAKGRLLPFGWYHLLKLIFMKKYPKVLDLLLVAVKPEYQNKGVNALLFYDLIPVYQQLGFEYAESNPELELNGKVQAQWEYFKTIQHKRRRAYKKSL
jgi:GNAT superfamily N-acetyltransferase